MKTKLLLAGLLTCIGISAKAQDATPPAEPKGKAIIQVFANLHSGFGHTNSDRGFELERSYLGYQYKLENGLEFKAVMDIGAPSAIDDYHRIAYIKNAQVTWKHKGLTLNGGLISTTQFNFQEKRWGYRYIMKSFQDKYKFGSSADLGLSASYKFADWVSGDAIIVNGEGYKKVQVNAGLLYGLGFTFTPVKGFNIRVYGSINEGADRTRKEIYNAAAFVGYTHEKFSLGVEADAMMNASNKAGHNMYGLSGFGSVRLHKQVDMYARYDMLASNGDWNVSKDEQAAILGAQIALGKYVKIAPNVRLSVPKDGGRNTWAGYISCYFGL